MLESLSNKDIQESLSDKQIYISSYVALVAILSAYFVKMDIKHENPL